MTYKAIAKSAGSCPVKILAVSPTPINFSAAIERALIQSSITPHDLASHVGCALDDVEKILAGSGRVEILTRAMDALKIDLTGIKRGLMLHQRLQSTRESRKWSIERLAVRAGLPVQTIEALETGCGRVNDLMIVLNVLAPKIGIRSNPLLKDASDKDSRFTPKLIADAIKTAFGKIAFDPCAHPRSPVKAPRQIFKAAGQDGLTQDWSGQVVFVNPPYSSSSAWLRKINVEWQAGRIGLLLCLVNSKTDAREYHAALSNGASVFFFEGRIKYVKPDGTQEPSSQPSMMIAFGTTPEQRKAFADLVEGLWMCREA
jgi:DNA-binding XRE family transcriptional regulator